MSGYVGIIGMGGTGMQFLRDEHEKMLVHWLSLKLEMI